MMCSGTVVFVVLCARSHDLVLKLVLVGAMFCLGMCVCVYLYLVHLFSLLSCLY